MSKVQREKEREGNSIPIMTTRVNERREREREISSEALHIFFKSLEVVGQLIIVNTINTKKT